MPAPKPKAGESQDDFISRCIKFFHDEGSDIEDDQMAAACYDAWRKAKGESALPDELVEKRTIPLTELRVVSAKNKPPAIEGYAAIFNSLSEDLGGWREKIAPGAFRKALRRSDTRMLYNHNQDWVLGRKSAGTLTLKEDDRGLLVRATPPKWADWIVESIDRGDVNQMSFGFITEKDEWDHKSMTRTLLEVAELPDVTIATYPAYPKTTVHVRSKVKEMKDQQPDLLRSYDGEKGSDSSQTESKDRVRSYDSKDADVMVRLNQRLRREEIK